MSDVIDRSPALALPLDASATLVETGPSFFCAHPKVDC